MTIKELHKKVASQDATIRELVKLVDELRQPFNNSKRHDLYEKATNILNRMEDANEIPIDPVPNIARLEFVKVGYEMWTAVPPSAEYAIHKVVNEYRVFCMHKLVGGGITLEQAIEVAREHNDQR